MNQIWRRGIVLIIGRGGGLLLETGPEELQKGLLRGRWKLQARALESWRWEIPYVLHVLCGGKNVLCGVPKRKRMAGEEEFAC